MERDDVLERLREAAAELEHLVQHLPERLLSERLERWTPRDVVAHLVGWNHAAVRGLGELLQGQTPFDLQQADDDSRTLNAESVGRWGGQERGQLLAEFRASAQALLRTLESLPEEAWARDFGVRFRGEVLTVRDIAVALVQDCVSHTERLRAWTASRGAQVARTRPLRTALHRRHQETGARMVPFAGWEMPLQYSGIVAEHRAVRTSAGLFDVSHMGEVRLDGPGAIETLDRVLCNDPRRLEVGQALYTPLCNEAGGVLDDLVACRLGEHRFLLVVNAARRESDAQWLRDHAQGCRVRDVSFFSSLLALLGPRAQELLGRLVDADLGTLGRFRVLRSVRVAGVRAVVSRTGYTGEDGFEILTAWQDALPVWDALVALGATPCGLGARDTLRLEAGYLLYGADLDETTTPWEAGLGWTVKLDGRTFVGADALRRQRQEGVRRRLCGLVLEGRAIARSGSPVRHGGRPVGTVTSGTFGPWVERSIALAYVPPDVATVGTRLEVEVRGRPVPAEVVRLPFYRRPATDPV